jgi:hypothetical protein
VLPVADTLNQETVRNHLHAVVNRIEQELDEEQLRLFAFENLSPKLPASMVRGRSRLNIKTLIEYLYQMIQKTDLPGPHSQPSYGIMSFRFIRRPLFPFFL